MNIDPFVNIGETVLVGGSQYKAVINRTTSRYRDLLPLLTKDEQLAEIFINKYPMKRGELIESNGDQFRVLEVREAIDKTITHCLCAMRTNPILRDGNKFK